MNTPPNTLSAAPSALVFDHESVDVTQRMEKWQQLEPGVYWRAKDKVQLPCTDWAGHFDTFEQGTVLLLMGIDYFDDKPHTVVLLCHPLDGSKTQHQFLVDDFLNSFDPAPDGEDVRNSEMAELQKDVAKLQEELMHGQINPLSLASFIEQEVREWEEEAAKDAQPSSDEHSDKSAATRDSKIVATGGRMRTDLGFAVANRLTQADINAMQHIAQREAKIADIKVKWIQSKIAKISEKMTAMTPFFEEKSAVALAKTQGVMRYADDIVKGIQSLDLYTGKGVDVQLLCDGEDASSTLPLTLFQRKLFCDEELAVWADVGENFDFTDMAQFDAHLKENASLLNQLLPSERSVVSMAARRHAIDYGDVWTNLSRNAHNKHVFLLVRNGGKVYRVYSSQPTHECTLRLFPTRDDFDRLFRGIDGETITFRDIQFTQRASSSENLALHFKRFLILLCGLDHRLNLFGKFYDREDTMSFISLGFQEKYFNFVADDEEHTLLGQGNPSINEWLKTKNSYLQSGSRVLCVYQDLLNDATTPSLGRLSARPVKSHEVLIVYKDKHEMCVDVLVAKTRLRHTGERFNARVSLSFARQNEGAIPFLCLDDVKADDLDYYVNNRASRAHQASYIRLFKTTANTLHAEEIIEEQARAYIRQAVVAAGVADDAQADDAINASIRAWRCANRGAALPSIDDKKSFDTILSHVYSLQQRQPDFINMIDAYIERHPCVPLKAVLTGKNRLGLYVEVPAAERDNTTMDWRWVTRISLDVKKNGVSESSRKLVWLTGAPDAKENTIKSWPEYDGWINPKLEPFKPKILTDATQFVNTAIPDALSIFEGEGCGISQDWFDSLLAEVQKQLYESKRLRDPIYLFIPIATFIGVVDQKLAQIYLNVSDEAQHWLYHYADNDQRELLKQEFPRQFKNKKDALSRLMEPFKPVIRASIKNAAPISIGATIVKPEHLYKAQIQREPVAVANATFQDLYSAKIRGTVTSASVKLGMDKILINWVAAFRPDRKPDHYTVSRALINPMVWNGEESCLERLFKASDCDSEKV